MEIKFSIPIDCRPAPRPRVNRTTVFYPQWYTELKTIIATKATVEMAKYGYVPVKAPVIVKVQVERNIDIFKPQFGDVDNLLKTVLDALTGVCYDDDRYVKAATVNKLKATSPKLTVQVTL